MIWSFHQEELLFLLYKLRYYNWLIFLQLHSLGFRVYRVSLSAELSEEMRLLMDVEVLYCNNSIWKFTDKVTLLI